MRRSILGLLMALNACGFDFPDPDRGAAEPPIDAPPTDAPPPGDLGDRRQPVPDPDVPELHEGMNHWAPAPLAPSSCKALHQEDPSRPDGIYQIDFNGAATGGMLSVYCDMTIDGGGWTLIGRSVPDYYPGYAETHPIGWYLRSGSIGDDEEPYSLDVYERGLGFTEVLIGGRGRGKSWEGAAYVFQVPPRFLDDCRETECAVRPRRVRGDCDPAEGPTALRFLGETADWGRFPIGDDRDQPRGLFPHGFKLGGTDCASNGELEDRQGMIFVR